MSRKDINIKIILPNEQFQRLNNKYIYIYDVGSHFPFDSVKIQNTINFISFNIDDSFVPHRVVLMYDDYDSLNKNYYRRRLGFKNPYKNNSINSSFYIDNGNTTIGLFFNKNSYVNDFNGSVQNIPFFIELKLSYPNTDKSYRDSIIENNIRIINNFPYSIELLDQIFNYKNYFTNKELKSILKCFNSDIKKTIKYKNFDKYFEKSLLFDKTFPENMELLNENIQKNKLQNNDSKFQLIVFWASWCAPCRKEIPQLKVIYELYKSKGLEIKSISIDKDLRSWKDALKKEKMPWQQFIDYKNSANLYFDIKYIPKSYLFHKQTLIAKFDGNINDFQKSINKFIK